jgi:predicted ATPase
MPYLTRIHIDRCRNVRDLDVDLSVLVEDGAGAGASNFRHLIVTGPNGSGKSGILEALAAHVGALLPSSISPVPGGVTSFWSTYPGYAMQALPESLRSTNPFVADGPERRSLSGAAASGELTFVYLPAKRQSGQQTVAGPAKLAWAPAQLSVPTTVSQHLLQVLVNKKTEAAFAGVDGDQATVSRIESWFASFEHGLRRLMEDQHVTIEFDRKAFNYRFQRDGYTFDLHTLADGHAAVLGILAELLIRVDASREARHDFTYEPSGVAIIDEIETHLHLSLQEQILPLLTDFFPTIQFIVATHSPAVIASIDNAVVYDLRSRKQVLSNGFRGVPYGTLMTEHFGLSSEIDLESTEKLLRLRDLSRRADRTPEEEGEMAALMTELTRRSPALAVEVWMVKEGLSTKLPRAAADGS